jgi:Holliday junction resolvasome RuvABC endonuclease subunit
MERTKHKETIAGTYHSPRINVEYSNGIYNILALDPATHCGWAVSRQVYGVWNLSAKRDESAGMRLIRLRSKLHEIIPAENINLVVFERPGGRFKASIIVQSEIQGQIKTVCEDMLVEYRAYSSKEIKLYATGKGGAGKPAMIKAAQDKLGYPGNDDNEADALWLLEMAKNDYK